MLVMGLVYLGVKIKFKNTLLVLDCYPVTVELEGAPSAFEGLKTGIIAIIISFLNFFLFYLILLTQPYLK
jgi:hypothetical protein